MKLEKLVTELIVVAFVISYSSSCGAGLGNSLGASEHQIHRTAQRAVRPAFTSFDPKQPRLYHFVANSDAVVIAWVSNVEARGRTKKLARESSARSGDPATPVTISINDIYTGKLYTLRIDKVLYLRPEQKALADELYIFSPSGSDSVAMNEGQRYLIFLERQPEVERFIEEFELETEKKYFRPFVSKIGYLSYSPPLGSRGLVDLSDSANEGFGRTVDLLTGALGESTVQGKLARLRALASAEDAVLAQNARYAIKLLESQQ